MWKRFPYFSGLIGMAALVKIESMIMPINNFSFRWDIDIL